MSDEAHEELRKIQVTGGSTYIVSLPKEWMEQMGIKKGSIMSISKTGPLSLSIRPQSSDSPDKVREVIITPFKNDTPQSLVRRVISSYLIGYNIIKIRSKKERLDSSCRYTVKDFTRRKLVGTEILSDLPNELTLHVLLSYSELSIKDALRRMSLITASMHREAIYALSSQTCDLSRDVIAMDDEVDRFNLYIIRLLKAASVNDHILKESELDNSEKCQGFRLITKSVERAADHAVNIAKSGESLNRKSLTTEISEELEKISKTSIGIFEDSIESLFEEDPYKAEDVLNRSKSLKTMEAETIHKIIKYAEPEDIPDLRLIVESIRRTGEYGTDIAETVLNMTVRNEFIET